MAKDRLPDPTEIRALEFKGEILQIEICSGSAAIDIDRSIPSNLSRTQGGACHRKNTVTRCSLFHVQQVTA